MAEIFPKGKQNAVAYFTFLNSVGYLTPNDIEFFAELVNDLLIKGLTDEGNEAISVDLRKHFESDVQKLKNATNSIQSILFPKWKTSQSKKINGKLLQQNN